MLYIIKKLSTLDKKTIIKEKVKDKVIISIT